MTVEATVKWTKNYQFIARSGKGPGVIMDSTDGASGPTPTQFVLMGVAGCTGIDVVSILKKKRIDLRDLEVKITGEQAETHPARFTKVHVEYVLYGKGIKETAVEQAIELSETKYCSALASLNAEFEHSYRIVNEDEESA